MKPLALEDRSRLVLQPGELHLWLLDPGQTEELAGPGEAWLPMEERLRADVFPRAQQRQRYVGRRAALRMILSRYTGLAPQSLPLVTAPEGKPFLAGDVGGPQFSLSASDGWVLVAVGRGGPVGVDLERIQTGMDNQVVAKSFLDPVERLLLNKVRPEERDQLFFRAWTRAESWLKMTGQGLAGLETLALERPQSLWVRDLHLPNGLAGALCLAQAPSEVRWLCYAGGQPKVVVDHGFALAPLHLLED